MIFVKEKTPLTRFSTPFGNLCHVARHFCLHALIGTHLVSFEQRQAQGHVCGQGIARGEWSRCLLLVPLGIGKRRRGYRDLLQLAEHGLSRICTACDFDDARCLHHRPATHPSAMPSAKTSSTRNRCKRPVFGPSPCVPLHIGKDGSVHGVHPSYPPDGSNLQNQSVDGAPEYGGWLLQQ